MVKLHIRGNLVGQRLRAPAADVVHIQESIEGGPAENAFVLVCHTGGARYLSWIGYYDFEYANKRQPGAWTVVEPPRPYQDDADWFPYRWDGAERVPTIGDSILAAH